MNLTHTRWKKEASIYGPVVEFVQRIHQREQQESIRADERAMCAEVAKCAPFDHDPVVTRRNSVEAIRNRRK